MWEIKVKKDNDKKKIALIIGAVIIVILIGIIVYLFLSNGKEEKRNVITQENVDSVLEEMSEQEYVEPGYYSTQMSTTWHFSSGNAVSEDAYVKNDASNTNDVYFDVFLASDESSPIYESDVIPRGAELDHIALDENLGAGTYDCVMVYHLIDDDQNTVSTLRVGFTIVVES